MFHRFRTLLAVCTVAFLAACGGNDDERPNIVETAVANPNFSILVEAVSAAGLADTLSGPGPLTVFAPTNDAFALLLTELGVTKAQLLADKPLLTAVLTYHVVPAKVLKAGVPLGKAVTTVQGDIFKVDAVGADIVITDGRNRTSKITTTDILASNGVIHVIDKVILPANSEHRRDRLWQRRLSSASWLKRWSPRTSRVRSAARARSRCSLPPTPRSRPC